MGPWPKQVNQPPPAGPVQDAWSRLDADGAHRGAQSCLRWGSGVKVQTLFRFKLRVETLKPPRVRPPRAVPCDRWLREHKAHVAASRPETPLCMHRRPSGWGASLVDSMPGRASGAVDHLSELHTNPTAPHYQDLAGPLLQRTHSQFAAQLERALNSR